MREALLNRRQLIVLAAAVALFGASTGAIVLLIAGPVFELEGERLVVWVMIGSGVGAVLGGTFAQPLFSAALDRMLAVREPPIPNPEEMARWAQVLRDAVLRSRVQGAKSQREQMLRGGILMELAVTRDLDLRPGRGGRPRVRTGVGLEPFSQLAEDWGSTGGRLVVLGEPGYGKTLAALALIGHVNRDDNQVAELFPLVDWHSWSAGRDEPAIEDWLIDQLTQSYPDVTEAAAWALIAQGSLVPIFDGLDEVPEGARSECRDALEAYAGRTAPFRPFVVTCRQSEYLALAPQWVGAERHVCLVGLDNSEIAEVLRTKVRDPERWAAVTAAVEGGDERLVSLLRSPLRLVAAIEIYEGGNPEELFETAARSDAGEELWNRLLGISKRTFEGAERTDVRRWLSFLAASLRSHDRQRLWLHELYLYAAPVDRRRYLQLGFAALFVWLTVPEVLLDDSYASKLTMALVLVVFIYTYRSVKDSPMAYTVRDQPSVAGYLRELPETLAAGAVVGVGAIGVFTPVLFVLFALSRLLAGETIYLDASALGALRAAAHVSGFVAVLSMVVILGESGESNVAEEPPASLVGRGPGAVIRATRDNAIFSAGLAALVFSPLWLFFDSPIMNWKTFGFAVGIAAWVGGLDAWAFYHWVRWRLHRAGHIPRRLRRFLDWASADTGWLRAGDAYEFRHRELLDFLAREAEPLGAGNLSWAESSEGVRDRHARARAQARRGARLWRARDLDGAREAYLAAIRLQPEEAAFRRDLAAVFEQLGDSEAQLEQALAALQVESGSARAHTQAAIAYERLGKADTALVHARRAVDLDPQSVQNRVNLAVILHMLGRDSEELEELDRALALRLSGDKPLAKMRSQVAGLIEARRIGVEEARQAAHEAPADPMAYWRLAQQLRTGGDAGGAEVARRRAVELALGKPELQHRLAMDLSPRGYRAEALRLLERAPTPAGSDPGCLAQRAQLLIEVGHRAEGRSLLRAAEKSAAEPGAMNSVAIALMAAGQFADAADYAERAQRDAPEDQTFAFSRAEALLSVGDLDSARKAFVAALELAKRSGGQPGDPAWLCALLWRDVGAAPRPLAMTILVEEYGRFGLIAHLSGGVTAATPVVPAQDGRDPDRLDEWCREWARHTELRRGVGILRTLAAGAEEFSEP